MSQGWADEKDIDLRLPAARLAAIIPRWPHFLKFMFRISAPRSWKGKNRSVRDHRGRGFAAEGAASPVRKIDPMTGEVIAIIKPE
jgi:hypothetical protein